MALLYARSADARMRTPAYDILTLQQDQIGIMGGRLDARHGYPRPTDSLAGGAGGEVDAVSPCMTITYPRFILAVINSSAAFRAAETVAKGAVRNR